MISRFSPDVACPSRPTVPLLRRLRARNRPVEMDVSPLPVLFLPDTGFLSDGRWSRAVGFDSLRQSGVRHDSHAVTKQLDRWRGNRGLSGPAACFHLEIEAVKWHSFDQMAATFWFEGGQSRIAQIRIRIPVLSMDRVQHLLAQGDQLSFSFGRHVSSHLKLRVSQPSERRRGFPAEYQ